MDLEEDDLDALDAYEPILDEVVAGRTDGHRCPRCKDGVLSCRFDGVTVRLECPKCGKWFEGVLA